MSVERDTGAVKPPILEIRGLGKIYRNSGHELTVLRDIHLTLQAGDTCAIIGPSGSGRPTLAAGTKRSTNVATIVSRFVPRPTPTANPSAPPSRMLPAHQ